jgi:hypothetical protein
MVEGLCAKAKQSVRNLVRISQELLRRYSKDFDSVVLQPFRANLVSRRAISHIVREPIDLDRKLVGRTVEVENVGPDRMLSPEADFGAAQSHPKKFLRQRRLAPQSAGSLEGIVSGAHALTPPP